MSFFESKGQDLKDYFRRLRFYSQIGSKVEILKILELDDGRIVVDYTEMG